MSEKKPRALSEAARRRTALLLVVLVLPLLMVCELAGPKSEQQQVRDTADEWTEAKGLDPTNEDGSLNAGAAAEAARRIVTGSTGDPEVDAALWSDDALAKIDTADDLEERGWKENNSQLFDQAVKLRPEDWKYYISRAAWNMDYYASPDMDKADRDFERAENLLGPDKQERIAYAQQGIAQMERVKATMSKAYREHEQAPLFSMPHDCRTVFSRLAHFYGTLADQTGDAGARAQAEQYTRDLAQCAPEK